MAVKSRQAENSAATRAVLLKIARRFFAERGFADTATEEIVRRARVTRGALYHHFKDKQDLFRAVLHEEQLKVAAKCTEAAAKASDPWRALMAANDAFLEACLDPAVQQIVLIDAPAVLGTEGFRQSDESYYLAGLKAAIEAAIAAGIIEHQPVEALAHMIMGSMNEAARLIAHASDKERARREVSESSNRVWNGLRIDRKR
ncbi:TetR/AcrR family transcriptional regulator [Candidatus Binatus sp.]|uniref:TetR/AcrR family transcriptional regulator n=1 Tax=Candidatus Binatus sp. TaxID=2811406 RepID=UPI003BB0348A